MTSTAQFTKLLESMSDPEMELFADFIALPSDGVIATQTRNIAHKIAVNDAIEATYNTSETTSILGSK